MIRVEMERRFGDSATIDYIDVNAEGSRETHRESVEVIQERGLIYPVTMIEGSAMYDGAVSYPAILRAVETVLAERVQ